MILESSRSPKPSPGADPLRSATPYRKYLRHRHSTQPILHRHGQGRLQRERAHDRARGKERAYYEEVPYNRDTYAGDRSDNKDTVTVWLVVYPMPNDLSTWECIRVNGGTHYSTQSALKNFLFELQGRQRGKKCESVSTYCRCHLMLPQSCCSSVPRYDLQRCKEEARIDAYKLKMRCFMNPSDQGA
jgi:hypothetical protein